MDIEPWLGTAAIVGTVIGTAIAGIFGGKKAARQSPVGEAQVLAASIVPQTEMHALTQVIAGLTPVLIDVAKHLNRINERLHEEELVRAAAAKIREDRL